MTIFEIFLTIRGVWNEIIFLTSLSNPGINLT